MDEISAFAQKFDDGVKVGHEKVREEGEKRAKLAVAKTSLKAGVSVDVIVQITGLSLDEIKQLDLHK
ncbi:hypothetical protein JTE90_008780 [Oedothorax gibbosus]|uniref:Transposase n=1 Tax=Oedothorax gibbosus TaxID=931172 RepID=A0AAV6V4N0_9ARAC|nr:hypothetical protein JTE90_008780 [Oedothorax gibbosus]